MSAEEKRPQDSWRLTITEMKFHSSDVEILELLRQFGSAVDRFNTEKFRGMRTVKSHPKQHGAPVNSKLKKKHAISVSFFFHRPPSGHHWHHKQTRKLAARKSTLRCGNGVTFPPPSPITKQHGNNTETIHFFWHLKCLHSRFYITKNHILHHKGWNNSSDRRLSHQRHFTSKAFFWKTFCEWDWSKKLKNNTKLKNIRWSLKEPQDTEGHLFCAKLIDKTFLAGTCLRGFCLQISGATFKSRHFADQTGHGFHCKDSAFSSPKKFQ